MSDIVPLDPESERPEGFDSGRPDDTPKVGTWYWVRADRIPYNQTAEDGSGRPDVPFEWLGCVMEVGSNFVELHSPSFDRSHSRERVHFDDMDSELRPAPDADAVIRARTQLYQGRVNDLLGVVREVTARLGVVPTKGIEDRGGAGDNALAVIATQVDAKAYKADLVKAKDETLPDLFKQIEAANKSLAGWMVAPTLPIRAEIGPMKKSIGAVEDRIYTIGLYAGLAEDAVKIADGDPAASAEMLRVMQRRLYMDEECLANYRAGGMEFKEIGQFDAWLAQPENRDRILPFPRCLVAFRVRRTDKDRDFSGGIASAILNFQLRQADEQTYLYVRNGGQIWRVDCDFRFDELIIPTRDEFDPTQPMMVKMFNDRVDKMIPKSAYDLMVEEKDAQRRLHDEWNAAHPDVKNKSFENPHSMSGWYDLDRYEPFNATSVYFDEASEFISAAIKRYNRVAVIIQGLYDRSLVLHPHPPVSVWDAASFARSIELVYDSETLTHGDKPDFEAYRAQLNESLGPSSIVVGQEEFWLRRMAAKENERQANRSRWDQRSVSDYKRYHPYGDPGPGFVGRMTEWKPRSRRALFRWTAETQSWRADGTSKPRSVEVPAAKLLNVSAYQPGDYKRFLSDSRTRAEYLKWAPLMMAAEDYHAGKLPQGTEGGDSEWA